MLGNIRVSALLVRIRAAERLMRHVFLQGLLLHPSLGSGVDNSLLFSSDTVFHGAAFAASGRVKELFDRFLCLDWEL